MLTASMVRVGVVELFGVCWGASCVLDVYLSCIDHKCGGNGCLPAPAMDSGASSDASGNVMQAAVNRAIVKLRSGQLGADGSSPTVRAMSGPMQEVRSMHVQDAWSTRG